MKIAVQGCGHGDLNKIYAKLAELEARDGIKADLLIVCGDFQAIRNRSDLQTMACPPKYRRMGDFYEYYTGQSNAPVLTLFIGGNHEASSHLAELYHGGWVAPNIYFLGYAGVVKFGGLRIGAISGIYNARHYRSGYYECPPYTETTIRSIYHTREFDVCRLEMLQEPIDIFVSHEWPHEIYRFGDMESLLKCKPYFREDIERGMGIGAVPLRRLLEKLRPKKWFAAHMHVEFEACVKDASGNRQTEFLALDKCVPGRRHLRIVDIPDQDNADKNNGNCRPGLCYDREWLSVVRAMNPFMSFQSTHSCMPQNVDLSEHRQFVNAIPDEALWIPRTYMRTSNIPGRRTTWLQTAEFCKLLQIKDHWN